MNRNHIREVAIASVVGGALFILLAVRTGWRDGITFWVLGGVCLPLGVGAFVKPKIFGRVLLNIIALFGKHSSKTVAMQTQTNNSTQAIAGQNSQVTINNFYPRGVPHPDKDEEASLIHEIEGELTTKPLSDILIKCVRLARLLELRDNSDWLLLESKGYDVQDELPDYREIRAEIRLNSDGTIESVKRNLVLTNPIFELERWIRQADSEHSSELAINAPVPPIFEESFRKAFGIELPEERIPHVVKVSEIEKIINAVKLRINNLILSAREKVREKG